jgi:hypothetical protein
MLQCSMSDWSVTFAEFMDRINAAYGEPKRPKMPAGALPEVFEYDPSVKSEKRWVVVSGHLQAYSTKRKPQLPGRGS